MINIIGFWNIPRRLNPSFGTNQAFLERGVKITGKGIVMDDTGLKGVPMIKG